MKKRIVTSAVFAFAMLLSVTGTALAQSVHYEDAIYIKPRIGFDYYSGDRDANPNDEFSRVIELRGLNFGAEIGYQVTRRLGIGVLGTYGNFSPLDTQNHPTLVPPLDSGASENRFTAHIVAPIQLAPNGRISPYIVPGIGIVGGTIDDNRGSNIGLAPMLGVGVNVSASERLGIFLELDGLVTLPDDTFDGVESGDSNYDVVGISSIGFRYNLRPPFVPVSVLTINGPSTIDAGDDGTYEASTNPDASQPVDYMWDFGDGTTASGMVATHSFATPGTYTVSFTASNKKSSDTRTMTVQAERPVTRPSITSITMNPPTPDTETAVQFGANIGGDGPFTYRWDFGDGTTSTSANPSHTYTTPGTYTVTATATNSAGSDTRTSTITVVPVEVDFCDTVVDLNSAFFGRNSSTLNADAQAALQDNLQILTDCPNMNARIEGFAAPGERSGTRLSEARARAVEQFYIDNGVAASRLTAAGMGTVSGVSRKEGLSQYRRADSLPVR
ncbi:MAG: PKD domain-containing protein [Rhodothermales bacterium]|nr:PKD domain-containing protein [Rhodothermales bacterium]